MRAIPVIDILFLKDKKLKGVQTVDRLEKHKEEILKEIIRAFSIRKEWFENYKEWWEK